LPPKRAGKRRSQSKDALVDGSKKPPPSEAVSLETAEGPAVKEHRLRDHVSSWTIKHSATVFRVTFQRPLDRDPAHNLVYGAGIHACAGAPMARLELRVLLEELFDRTSGIRPIAGKVPVNAIYPAAGYSELFLRFGS
jgi:hypothetical protein